MTNLWPAINNLRMEATRLRQTSRRAEAAEGMDIAASVLEAAGGVDKHSALCSMRHSDANEAWSGMGEDWQAINAMLAALPDAGKE